MKVVALDQPVTGSLGDFTVKDPAFAPLAGQTAAIIVDGKTFLWNGSNDSGQQVSSGLYWVKVTTKDSYGNVTAFIHEVTVLAVANQYRLRVFNSAGELVRTLAVTTFSSGTAPKRLLPDVSAIAFGPDPSSVAKVNFDLGGVSVAWNGLNDMGVRVQSGTYTVQLESESLGAASTIASTSVVVLNSGESVLNGGFILPNPVPASAASFTLRLPHSPAGTVVTARLYNVAGELIMTSVNDMLPDRVNFDLGGRTVSGGLYLVAVTAKAPWGEVERKTFKMVMVR